MIKDLTKKVMAILNELPELVSTEENRWSAEIYVDHRDELDSKTVIIILNEEDPWSAFWDTLSDMYIDTEPNLSTVVWDVKEKLKDKGEYVSLDDESEIEDIVMETVDFVLPEDHFLQQEFNVPVLIDTGDGNYDYILNTADKLDDKASIVWLAGTQGVSKEALQQYLDDENAPSGNGDFLASLKQELENVTSDMNVVAFLTRMTLRDLLDINTKLKEQTKPRKITVTKSIMCGLYDPFLGGGSVLEVELEKDVEIPFKIIRSCLPDGGDNYGVDDIYGLTGKAWQYGEYKIG